MTSTTKRDIEIYKDRKSGITYRDLAKKYDISKTRCSQIFSKVKEHIRVINKLMKIEELI